MRAMTATSSVRSSVFEFPAPACCSKLALKEGMAWRERVGMARLARDLLRVRTAHALHRRVGCIELAAVVGIVAQERNGDRAGLAEHLPHVLHRVLLW